MVDFIDHASVIATIIGAIFHFLFTFVVTSSVTLRSTNLMRRNFNEIMQSLPVLTRDWRKYRQR